VDRGENRRRAHGTHQARQGTDECRKFGKKFAKHAAWIAVALWTGFTFAGYFTPIATLARDLVDFKLGPWQTFWIFFYAFATYGMAGFMREQVCKYMCPYARFQSVMFDADTLIVTYDAARGEPRGARSKKAPVAKGARGDCVDCDICVQVCPTGIDIRNGLQYECIGCSACIDGCDEVMDKLGAPRGLIRYSTENAMQRNWSRADILRHVLRPRIAAVRHHPVRHLRIAAAWGIATRLPLKVDVIRDRAAMAREVEDERIENVYTLRVMNTDEQAHRYRDVQVGPASTHSLVVSTRVPPEAGPKGSLPIRFDIEAEENQAIRLTEKAAFLMP
jgi:cytochrome c oxidase accessory protein FixG